MTESPSPRPRGHRLVDAMIGAVQESGMSGVQVGQRFGVSTSWYDQVRNGRIRSPSADTVQAIYEQLTGRYVLGPKEGHRDGD